MSGSLPPGVAESRLVRTRQLHLLHELASLNHQLGRTGLPVYRALELVRAFDTVCRELQEWTALVEAYPVHGLDSGSPCLAALVRRAMLRVGRANRRLAGRLEVLLQDLPREAPILKFGSDGRLL